MRKLIYILILITIGCNRKSPDIHDSGASLITGTYHFDSTKNSLLLASYNIAPEEYNSSLIQLDSNQNFTYPIYVEFPQPLTISAHRPFNLFIFPGDTINVNISDSLQLTCNNRIHQNFILNYLKLNDLIQESINKFPFYESVQNNIPEQFKSSQYNFRNRLSEKIKLFLKEESIQDKDFEEMALLEVQYLAARHLIDYKLLNKIQYKKEVILPENFFSLADSLTKYQTVNFITYNYFSFLNRLQLLYDFEKIDTLLEHLNNKSQTLTQDILLARSLHAVLQRDSIKTAKRYIDLYKNKIVNPFIRQSLIKSYDNKLVILKNPNIKNAILSDLTTETKNTEILNQIRKDHKGKVIYVKFWGPWCGPCMEEIPYDKMLMDRLVSSDFAFVNLCIKTTKENWVYTIKDKQLSGYHYLLNDDQYNELADLFNINGVPFHVLIGKDGAIENKNAPSPGSAVYNGLDKNFLNEITRLINSE